MIFTINTPEDIIKYINNQCSTLVEQEKSPYAVFLDYQIIEYIYQTTEQPENITIVPELQIMGLKVIPDELIGIRVITYEDYLKLDINF
ncbi:hypothetical protein ABFO59_06505 [Acinetobacter radioresistens]|uniref:hypothetical protein n=1 Tax=Acinetobacter radioresistens TaxID=40216 RepID=UPI0032146B19